MKRLFTSAIFIVSISGLFAQNNVGIGIANPDPTAVLDLTAQDKGVLVPRMSTAQRLAIPSPAQGLLVFDNTAGCFFYYFNAWVSVCQSGGASGNAGGDLSGTYPNPTVVGLQGYGVSNTAPSASNILQYNGTTWAPTNPNSLFWQLTGNVGSVPSTSAIGTAVNNNFIGTTDSKDFVLTTNNLERARITAAGNVGIGTVAPTTLLTVVNSAAGAIQIVDGTQALGNVLTSDANGVGTWQPASVKAVYATLGAGVDIPSTTATMLYTGTTLTLPPGEFAILVNMLLSPAAAQLTTNSAFWMRSTFSDVTVAPVPSPDIVGSTTLASGVIVAPSQYGLVNGTILINNSSGANKTYYYCGGNTSVITTTQTMTAFGGNAWLEDNIVAIPIK